MKTFGADEIQDAAARVHGHIIGVTSNGGPHIRPTATPTRAGRQVRTAGRLVVLSAGGAFLELDEGYPVGRPLRLRFELAALGKVGCRAILRRYHHGTGVGVEFLEVDPADQARITAFVKKHQATLR